MKRPREEPEHRFLGFPVSSYPSLTGRRTTRGSTDAAGSAASDGAPSEGRSGPALRHPFAWLRWRLAVALGGPHVPDFGEFRPHRPDPPHPGQS